MLQRVETFHKQMQRREGSEQIATKTILLKFGSYFSNPGYSPTVIDYGAGIGTVSLFASEIGPQSRRVAVEPNDLQGRDSQKQRGLGAFLSRSLQESGRDLKFSKGRRFCN